MPQLAHHLTLDLPHTFPGQAECATDLVEGARADIVVLDEPKRAPRTVIYGGSVIYDDGTIMPCGRSELNGVPVATPTA